MSLVQNSHSDRLCAEAAGFLERQRESILNDWLLLLDSHWGLEAGAKLQALRAEIDLRKDLFSTLLDTLSQESRAELPTKTSLAKVRTTTFSIVDLYAESTCLMASVRNALRRVESPEDLSVLDVSEAVELKLGNLLKVVLQNSSEVYEHVLESGGRAFCHFDADGRILYANLQFKNLAGNHDPIGKPLAAYFDANERDSVVEAGKGPERLLRSLCFRTETGDKITVGAEISRLIINGENRGGYASLMDIRRAIRLQTNVFDHSPLGILRVNLDAEIVYANPSILEMLGAKSLESKSIRQICNQENYAKIQDQLRHRREGISAEYEVAFTRLDDNRQVPVMLAGTPETDLSGKIIGSLGIIRSLVVEKANAAIHNASHTITDSQEILAAVAREIGNILPYDLMVTSVYSADLRHSRVLYTSRNDFKWQRRWWPLKGPLQEWVTANRSPIHGDWEDYFNQDRWKDIKAEKDVKQMLEKGLRFFVRIPVIRQDRVVAAVTLLARKPFETKSVELLQKVPVDHGVLMAFHYQEKNELSFRLSLFKAVSAASNDVMKVCSILVSSLAMHYQWSNVSIFLVDGSRQVFRLLSQRGKSTNADFKPGITLPLTEGILGVVYARKRGILIGNVHTSSEFRQIYCPVLPETVSEMCLPVVVGDKVRWLLNVEDSQEDAFASEEQESLELVLEELGLLLERSRQHHLLETMLESASDAVIVTDDDGIIRKLNPSACEMLGLPASQLLNASMRDRFKNNIVADGLLKAVGNRTDEVWLKRASGNDQNVLMSVSLLPATFGGKVFVSKNLLPIKSAERLATLERVYGEIANQLKAPLSLVLSMMQRLTKHCSGHECAEIVDKARRHLSQVELTFDRLFLAVSIGEVMPYHEVLLSMCELSRRLHFELPELDLRENLVFSPTDGLPLVRGDLFQLSFCLLTIISYLLKFVSEDDKIAVVFSAQDGMVNIDIKGFVPALSRQSSDLRVDLSKLLFEIELGEPIIRKFIGRHNGRYTVRRQEPHDIHFQIQLPAAKDI